MKIKEWFEGYWVYRAERKSRDDRKWALKFAEKHAFPGGVLVRMEEEDIRMMW